MEQPEVQTVPETQEAAPKSATMPVAGGEKKKGKIAAAKKSAAKTASEIAAKTKAASKVAVNAEDFIQGQQYCSQGQGTFQ